MDWPQSEPKGYRINMKRGTTFQTLNRLNFFRFIFKMNRTFCLQKMGRKNPKGVLHVLVRVPTWRSKDDFRTLLFFLFGYLHPYPDFWLANSSFQADKFDWRYLSSHSIRKFMSFFILKWTENLTDRGQTEVHEKNSSLNATSYKNTR